MVDVGLSPQNLTAPALSKTHAFEAPEAIATTSGRSKAGARRIDTVVLPSKTVVALVDGPPKAAPSIAPSDRGNPGPHAGGVPPSLSPRCLRRGSSKTPCALPTLISASRGQ
jgi:hypothetical protein